MYKNVISLPPTDTMTPEQALLSALDLARADDLQDVLIIGHDKSDHLIIRSSRMDCKDGLWLAEQARLHVLGIAP